MTTKTAKGTTATKRTKETRTTFYLINDATNYVLHVLENRTEKGAIKSAQTYLRQHRAKLADLQHATLYADQPCGGVYKVQGYYRQN